MTGTTPPPGTGEIGLDDPDYKKLMTLAMWLDVKDTQAGNAEPGYDEVQTDLRRIARRLIAVPLAPPSDVTDNTAELIALVVALSDHLTDEGNDWSFDGLASMRQRVANALPPNVCPDWLKEFRTAFLAACSVARERGDGT